MRRLLKHQGIETTGPYVRRNRVIAAVGDGIPCGLNMEQFREFTRRGNPATKSLPDEEIRAETVLS
jgi:hypothetical protein